MSGPSVARRITLVGRREAVKLLRRAFPLCSLPEFDVKVSRTVAKVGISFIITPRTSGAAHQRNLVKRRIKAIFYQNRLYEQGYNWLIFVKKGAHKLPFVRLESFLLSCVTHLPR
jgi:ribonuclease P protein component